MMMIKGLLLAGLMLTSALASGDSKPSMATLQVKSNFDFSLTRNEFRVYYSGLGGYVTSESGSTIKIYKQDSEEQEVHSFDVKDKNEGKIYQFALEGAQNVPYKVAVCVKEVCSEKSPALTDNIAPEKMDITCSRVVRQSDGSVKDSPNSMKVTFEGPKDADWIPIDDFDKINTKVTAALAKAGKTDKYETDFTKHALKTNPQYKHDGHVFFAALYYDIRRYKQLFDKMPARGAVDNAEYAHEFCERKYLLSTHAHLVDRVTKEVKYRFKTTLFLSDGGKKLYIFDDNKDKVHVEMTHIGEEIKEDTYNLWITFCATEKDVIDSTFCAEPIIKKDFQVKHKEE